MSELLVELLDAMLVKQLLNEDVSKGATDANLLQCFDLVLVRNVLPMTFPVMTSLSKELRPSFVLWSKWIAYP